MVNKPPLRNRVRAFLTQFPCPGALGSILPYEIPMVSMFHLVQGSETGKLKHRLYLSWLMDVLMVQR